MFIESVEQCARTEGEAFTLCKPEEILLLSPSKTFRNSLPRKFLDDFSYRENQNLVPSVASVSKKETEVWETSII